MREWEIHPPRQQAVFPSTLPREQGVYWIIWFMKVKSFDINPVANYYQYIHPYSALYIDNVEINTSLIMMRECLVFHGSTYTFGKIAHIKVQKNGPSDAETKIRAPFLMPHPPKMLNYMSVLCVCHFGVDFKPIWKFASFWAVFGPFSQLH